MNTKLLLFAVSLAIFISCSTDFEVNAPWEDKTVVFGMLDQSDDVQYVKINKTFLGEDDAFNMANVSDSFNYAEQLNVSLLRLDDEDDDVLETIYLVPTNEIVKDTGVFADDNNLLYKTEQKIRRNSRYQLYIEIPATGKIITAETTTIDTFKIDGPLYTTAGNNIKIPFGLYSDYRITFDQAHNSKICYINIYFNYYDITGTDTVLNQISYSAAPKVFNQVTENQVDDINEIVIFTNGEEFYKFVASALDVPPIGTKRLAESLDFEFYCGTDDYYTYYQVNNSSSGLSQSKPLYTNVQNGIGLFASKYKQIIYDKELNNQSLDSLSRGVYTKHLRFADSNFIWP